MRKSQVLKLMLCLTIWQGGLTTFAADSVPQAPARTPLPTPPPQAPLDPSTFPPPPTIKDASQLGLGIQRTMNLLATSTPSHRRHVKVLFYGQSITEQEWSKEVAADLRKRFPNADLEIENRAIGGFASQLLIRPAEHDVYPWYPDLVIFHVFGANQQYEQIIKNIRSRTTSEVLIQNDRVGAKWPQDNDVDQSDKGQWWDFLMNHRFVPDIARKYGCGLCDIRGGWLEYLRDNHYEPRQLLVKDGAHLNVQGNFLMARLTEEYLIYRPELADSEWKNLTHAHPVGASTWIDGKFTLEFEGNRVDLVPAAATDNHPRSAQILIDGKKPSDFPDAYRITRSTPGPWSPVFLSRVDHDQPLVLEEWTLKINHVSKDGKKWDFGVSGSVTGPDGNGHSDQAFTSNSARVKIEPAAWFRGFYPPLPDGYTIHWKVLPMFVDTYTPTIEDPTKENATTVIQGIPNGKHTLQVISDNPSSLPAIAEVRTYRPPVMVDSPASKPSR